MRVLLVSSDYNIFRKNSAVRERIYSYGSIFKELHIIVFTKRKDGYVAGNIAPNIYLYPTNSSSRWLYIFDAVRIGRQIKGMDVVSSQDPFESGLACWCITKATNAKFHIQIHTDFLFPHFVRAHGLLNYIRVLLARVLIPKADGVRVVSNRIKNSLKHANYKLKQEPVVLPIFVDVQAIRAQKPSLDLHKRYPSLNPILLVVARLEQEKNIGAIINILTEIRKSYPRAGLVIVGEGSEQEKLQGLVGRLALTRHVVFERWQKDVISHYKTADVVIQPSFYEGYGLVVAEALASGTPALSTDVGAAREMGAIIASIEQFGSTLLKMLTEPRKAELKCYPYENVRDYLRLYQKALEDCCIS